MKPFGYWAVANGKGEFYLHRSDIEGVEWTPLYASDRALEIALEEYEREVRLRRKTQEDLATLDERLVSAKVELGSKQAKIDALMLEYCPNEMTRSQVEEWMSHQRKVSPEQSAKIKAIVAKHKPAGR